MINDEKLIMISAFAALDTPGVAALSDGTSADMLPGIDRSKLTGVVDVVHIDDTDEINVSLSLVYESFDMLTFVSETVQQHVKRSVESLTDIHVDKVNVNVSNTF